MYLSTDFTHDASCEARRICALFIYNLILLTRLMRRGQEACHKTSYAWILLTRLIGEARPQSAPSCLPDADFTSSRLMRGAACFDPGPVCCPGHLHHASCRGAAERTCKDFHECIFLLIDASCEARLNQLRLAFQMQNFYSRAS